MRRLASRSKALLPGKIPLRSKFSTKFCVVPHDAIEAYLRGWFDYMDIAASTDAIWPRT